MNIRAHWIGPLAAGFIAALGAASAAWWVPPLLSTARVPGRTPAAHGLPVPDVLQLGIGLALGATLAVVACLAVQWWSRRRTPRTFSPPGEAVQATAPLTRTDIAAEVSTLLSPLKQQLDGLTSVVSGVAEQLEAGRSGRSPDPPTRSAPPLRLPAVDATRAASGVEDPLPATVPDGLPQLSPVAPDPPTPAEAKPPPSRPPAGKVALSAPSAELGTEAVRMFGRALGMAASIDHFVAAVGRQTEKVTPSALAGPRLAAAAIMAASRLKPDLLALPYMQAYEQLVQQVAGPDHELVWPEPGASTTADMDTIARGQIYNHAVEAVVYPGLRGPDADGGLILRPKVLSS